MDIENPYRKNSGISQVPCNSFVRCSLRNVILCVIVFVGLLSVWITHKNTYEEHNKVLSSKYKHLSEKFNSGGLRGSPSRPSENSNNNNNLLQFRRDDDDTKSKSNPKINNNNNKPLIELKKEVLSTTHQPTPSPTPIPTKHPTAHPTIHPTPLPTIHPTHTIKKKMVKKEQPEHQSLPQGQPIPQSETLPTTIKKTTISTTTHTTTKEGNVGSGPHIDYCAGNVDPFKKESVEAFKVPTKAPMSARRKWESSLKEMVDRVHKLAFGGQKLRDYLSTEVEKLEILRFELFCSFA